MMIPFTKMHGLGNDYVFIDARQGRIEDPGALSRALSNRHRGVGADGLILILPPRNPDQADLRMRIFNADGSEAQMCGNGIRCLGKLVRDRGLCTREPLRVETGSGVRSLTCAVDEAGAVDSVTVDMGAPILDDARIPVEPKAWGALREHLLHRGLIAAMPEAIQAAQAGAGDVLDAACVSMGNPHLVIFCSSVESLPVELIGPALERHEAFPEGVNAHFVEVNSPAEVAMRTWERGSGATRACGSGACAVCVATARAGRTGRDLRVRLPGGDLDVSWADSDDHVFMTGPAVEVFSGEWPAPGGDEHEG